MVKIGSALFVLAILTMAYVIWRDRNIELGSEPVLPVLVCVLCAIVALGSAVMVVLGVINMHIE